jgi:hypothetical protein
VERPDSRAIRRGRRRARGALSPRLPSAGRPVIAARSKCALRLSVRTQDFQSCKRGSTPLGRTNTNKSSENGPCELRHRGEVDTVSAKSSSLRPLDIQDLVSSVIGVPTLQMWRRGIRGEQDTDCASTFASYRTAHDPYSFGSRASQTAPSSSCGQGHFGSALGRAGRRESRRVRLGKSLGRLQ